MSVLFTGQESYWLKEMQPTEVSKGAAIHYKPTQNQLDCYLPEETLKVEVKIYTPLGYIKATVAPNINFWESQFWSTDNPFPPDLNGIMELQVKKAEKKAVELRTQKAVLMKNQREASEAKKERERLAQKAAETTESDEESTTNLKKERRKSWFNFPKVEKKRTILKKAPPTPPVRRSSGRILYDSQRQKQQNRETRSEVGRIPPWQPAIDELKRTDSLNKLDQVNKQIMLRPRVPITSTILLKKAANNFHHYDEVF